MQLWREQKLEAERLEAELEAQRRDKLDKRRAKEWEVEQKKRAAERDKVRKSKCDVTTQS